MSDITSRQKELLSSIIKEFIETADAVGSISLINKYGLNLSSATIRNEMAELVFRGYLFKKHSSAGRIPTHKAWRFFVDEQKKDLNLVDANVRLEFQNNISKLKTEKANLIRQSLNFLAMLAENATLAMIGKDLYYSGLSTLTKIPEFKESENLEKILKILEDYFTLSKVFNEKNKSGEDVQILIGEEETGFEEFQNYSVIFSEINFDNVGSGFIAVIGPNRMNYNKIIASVKYVTETIKHLVNSN